VVSDALELVDLHLRRARELELHVGDVQRDFEPE
jgi:hypothetical protein